MTATIAVTTTADRYRHWAGPLEARGLRPVGLPCIQIRPTASIEEARRLTGQADWLVITSPRVVRLMWPAGPMPPVPVAVVGEGTAKSVRAAQGRPEVVGDGDGERLVDLVAERLEGMRVVIPHGTRADVERFRRLAAGGAEVQLLPVYDTVPAGPDPRAAVDGAVFGSPTAVEGWTSSRTLGDLSVVGAIGHVTARALARHGVTRPTTPDRPDPDRLAAALSASLEVHL